MPQKDIVVTIPELTGKQFHAMRLEAVISRENMMNILGFTNPDSVNRVEKREAVLTGHVVKFKKYINDPEFWQILINKFKDLK